MALEASLRVAASWSFWMVRDCKVPSCMKENAGRNKSVIVQGSTLL
jgi:hypothetical protein